MLEITYRALYLKGNTGIKGRTGIFFPYKSVFSKIYITAGICRKGIQVTGGGEVPKNSKIVK